MNSVRNTCAVIVVGLVAAAGCASDSDSDTAVDDPAGTTLESTAASSEPAPPDPVVTETPVTNPPATDDSADTTTTVEAPGSSGSADAGSADCLVGDWVITQDEMNAYYDALEASLAGTGPAATLGVDGQVELTFTPTDFVYTANFDLTFGVAGQEGTGASTGTVSGVWSAADGVIVIDTTESDLSVSVSVGGITFDGTELANGLLNEAPINEAPFDCTGPTLGFPTGGGSPRHTVTLTPA